MEFKSREEAMRVFEERALRAREWTCPDCGEEWVLGTGVPIGSEFCTCQMEMSPEDVAAWAVACAGFRANPPRGSH